jgi:protein-tyrosine-phosphatase
VFAMDDRDDISDPYGGPLNTFRATARQLDDLLGHLVRAGRLNEA